MKKGLLDGSASVQYAQFNSAYENLPIASVIPNDTGISFDFPVSGMQLINRTDGPVQIQDGMDETSFFLGSDDIALAIGGSVEIQYGDVVTVTLTGGDPNYYVSWREQLEPYFGVGNVTVLPGLPVYGYFYLTYIKPGVNAPNPVIISNTLDNGGGPGSFAFLLYGNWDGNVATFKVACLPGESTGIIPISPISGNHIHLSCPYTGDISSAPIVVAQGDVLMNFFR